MFEPEGTGIFLLLIVAFAALLAWVAMAKQVVFRVLAACLAFVPAMAFGIASVNKFYDYYQTWGGMINDLTGQGANSIPKYSVAGAGSNRQFDKDIGRITSTAEDAQVGYLFQTPVTGQRSHLTRDVWVYLPPQYFQKSYAYYKFPGGIQDMTFVAQDVPDYIARLVRVQPPGRAWGLGGYSEGGYCTANIALQDPGDYAVAGVMSGYFAPIPSQVPAGNKPDGKPEVVNVFAGHPALQLVNTPQEYLTRVPITTQLPFFWLAAGAQDKPDLTAADSFRQVVETRQADVPFLIRSGRASGQRLAGGPRPDADVDDSASCPGCEGGHRPGGGQCYGPGHGVCGRRPRLLIFRPGEEAARRCAEEEVTSSSGFLSAGAGEQEQRI